MARKKPILGLALDRTEDGRLARPAVQQIGTERHTIPSLLKRRRLWFRDCPAPSHGHLSRYSILTWKVKEGLP